MVRAVALADAAFVVRCVRRRARCERAEPDRRPEPRLDAVDDSPRAFALDDRERTVEEMTERTLNHYPGEHRNEAGRRQ
jgi:hypothetical protein